MNSISSLFSLAKAELRNQPKLVAACLATLDFERCQLDFINKSNMGPEARMPFPGFDQHVFPVFGYLRQSKDEKHVVAKGVDPTHSIVNTRSAACSGDILGGYRQCFQVIAESELTHLTASDLVDRNDMQSDKKAHILFSR